MVAPPIISMFLSAGWLVVNVKIIYLFRELSAGYFGGWAMTGINPVTSEFSIFCYYFEVNVVVREIYFIEK